MKVTKATAARTVVLVIALLNTVLTMCGKNPLEISEETVYTLISALFTVGAAGWSWWKNNSFTEAAKEADLYLENRRKEWRANDAENQ